jgi:hypothetical protein
MPVPTAITDLSQTAASNFPAGSNAPSVLDDVQRAHGSFIATLRDGKGFTSPPSPVASAGTVDLGAQNSFFVDISGTTTITSFGTAYNGPRFVRFTGALLLTYNATSLVLPGAANITTAAGDCALIVPKATAGAADGWQMVSYQRAAPPPLAATGAAPIFGCRAWVNFNGTGTVAINASGNVSSITDNGVGDYTLNFTVPMPDTSYCVLPGTVGVVSQSASYQFGPRTTAPGNPPTLKSTTQVRLLSTREIDYDLYEANVAIFR